MTEIVSKKELSKEIKQIKVKAPLIANKAQAGQFIILKVDPNGERVPLTISNWDQEEDTITLIFQEIGFSTKKLGELEVGDTLSDLAGPLGIAAEIKKIGHIVCVGGGVGTAVLFPDTRALKAAGNRITSIIGAKNKESLILEEEMKDVSDNLYITTDDGSYGEKGFVTTKLKELIEKKEKIDEVLAIGPVPMMKAVSETTRPYGIHTIVSLNPIMVDGTGMCGACRVTVDQKTLFACVDGPEFDGHKVNFDELMVRLKTYEKEEAHVCRCQQKK